MEFNLDKGEYIIVSPIDHVNMHQSTNDVYPTALKVASILCFKELSGSVAGLQGVFEKKEKELTENVKEEDTKKVEKKEIPLEKMVIQKQMKKEI